MCLPGQLVRYWLCRSLCAGHSVVPGYLISLPAITASHTHRRVYRVCPELPRASAQSPRASSDFLEEHRVSQGQRDAWLRRLHKGQWVVLCGLVSRPDLNGVDARLLKEVPCVGRWALHVLHTSERFRVKYANISPQWTLPVPPSALPPTDFQQPIRRKLASCDFTVGRASGGSADCTTEIHARGDATCTRQAIDANAQSSQNRIPADSHLLHLAHSRS
jgi:hypothetical protein